MIDQRPTTAAFTGHRTYDGSHDRQITDAVRKLYADGFRTFLTGMAEGFDLAAGECVAALRNELPGLKLHCVVPFAGSKKQGERYRKLIETADKVTVLSPHYHTRAYHQRNDFLVDNSSALIAWFDGRDGGTEYTVRRALKSGLQIENLWSGLFEAQYQD
ncbi:MAG: DUF1273 family protein [Alistipes sp.]|nr:DUF1273 family protein [Alistipes sp.]